MTVTQPLTRTLLGIGVWCALAFAPVALTEPALADTSSCERGPAQIRYDGTTQNIYAAPGDSETGDRNLVELIFPSHLIGAVPERPEGLEIQEVPGAGGDNPLQDRVFISIDSDTYVGGVFFHTDEGESYHLRVIARPGCANTTVNVVDARPDPDEEAPTDGVGTRAEGELTLIESMYLGELPRGYRRSEVTGPKEERQVYQQGPVAWYLEEVWRGRDQSGYIIRVVNEGRTGFQIALEQIDVTDRRVQETFGTLREATMLPNDRRLGPSPEYGVDKVHPDHEGLIFLVAED